MRDGGIGLDDKGRRLRSGAAQIANGHLPTDAVVNTVQSVCGAKL